MRPHSAIDNTDGAEPETDKAHPASGRKGKKGEKGDKKKEAKEGKEKEHKDAASGDGTEHPEEGVPPLTAEEKRERRLENGIGIPHVVVDARCKDVNIFDKVRLHFCIVSVTSCTFCVCFVLCAGARSTTSAIR